MEICMRKDKDEKLVVIRLSNDRPALMINRRGDVRYTDPEVIGDTWEYTDEYHLVGSGVISQQQYDVYRRFKNS